MNRVIKNYTNITPMHIELIAKAFPEGFGDDDLQVLSALCPPPDTNLGELLLSRRLI